MTDGLPDGSTDKSNVVWMEGIFPGIWTFRKFHPGFLVGIVTVNFADGWMDGTGNRHTDGQMDFQV